MPSCLQPKGGKPGKDIPLGVQGFLLSCTQGREWQAGKEMVNVLEEVGRLLSYTECTHILRRECSVLSARCEGDRLCHHQVLRLK